MGTVIGVFVPLSPLVAFLIVIAARVERDGIAPAGSPGGASGEGEVVDRREQLRRGNSDPASG